ncbi:hypothetical protein [Alloactinosynnema sp. L-07]|nr:hypothetical protein [Alloactinosynnema sp. L-07]
MSNSHGSASANESTFVAELVAVGLVLVSDFPVVVVVTGTGVPGDDASAQAVSPKPPMANAAATAMFQTVLPVVDITSLMFLFMIPQR